MRFIIRLTIAGAIVWYIGACMLTIIEAGVAAIAIKEEVTQRVTGGR